MFLLNKYPKNFEELREVIYEERHSSTESFLDCFEELNDFQRGWRKGEIDALDGILSLIRDILKYSDEI